MDRASRFEPDLGGHVVPSISQPCVVFEGAAEVQDQWLRAFLKCEFPSAEIYADTELPSLF